MAGALFVSHRLPGQQPAMKKKRLPQFPHAVKDGSVNTLIRHYKWHDRKHRRKYSQFKFACYLQGERKVFTRSSFERSKDLARTILGRVNNGEVAKWNMSEADAQTFLRAKAEVWEFGVPLDQVASEWARYRKLAAGAGGVDIAEALRAYGRNHAGLKPATVIEVCNELVKAKRDAGRSGRHISDLDYRLGALKKFCGGMAISQVSAEVIREFLDFLRKTCKSFSPRSSVNFVRVLGTLFNFAKRRNFLPRDFDQLEAVERETINDAEPQIYTPAELESLLHHAGRAEKLLLAIGAFAGIRTKEVMLLDWNDFKFMEVPAVITVRAGTAKTASRRIIPISVALMTWLNRHAEDAGPPNMKGRIFAINRDKPYSEAYLHELLSETCLKAGVPWKPNALRHSYISYRLAEVGDAALVAQEAGNSPATIYANYRSLVTPQEAKRWFAIVPAVKAQPVVGVNSKAQSLPKTSGSRGGARICNQTRPAARASPGLRSVYGNDHRKDTGDG
jgi:integrase